MLRAAEEVQPLGKRDVIGRITCEQVQRTDDFVDVLHDQALRAELRLTVKGAPTDAVDVAVNAFVQRIEQALMVPGRA